ncbi:MAG: hypothetical protein WCI61_06015 [Chloroflexota bacterium]
MSVHHRSPGHSAGSAPLSARHLTRLFAAAILGLLFALPPARASAIVPHALSVSVQPTGTSCTEVLAKGPSTVTRIAADRLNSVVLCAHIEDLATRTDQPNIAVEFRTTVGTIGSSGTAHYSGPVFSSSAGIAQISYRGDGTSTGTDTVLVSYEPGRALAIATIEITPATGRVPAVLVAIAPAVRALAPTIARPGEEYASPTTGTAVAMQVRDANGLGVNGVVLAVRTDRGALVANPAFAEPAASLCAGARARTITLVSAATNVLAPGGALTPGTAPEDPPGRIAVTVEALTAALAPVALTLTQAGPPAAVEVRSEAGVVRARVADATGMPVADGTPVRFALAPTAGVLSTACTVTRDGVASAIVALDAPDGTVVASAEHQPTGAATCASPGTRQVTASTVVQAR